MTVDEKLINLYRMAPPGETPPPPPTPEELKKALEVEIATTDREIAAKRSGITHVDEQAALLERKKADLVQTPEGRARLAGLERLKGVQKSLEGDIAARQDKVAGDHPHPEGWEKVKEFLLTGPGALKDFIRYINPYANTDTMWTFILNNWETAQGAIGGMLDAEKHLVWGKAREALAGLTSAQAAIAVISMLANGTGVSIGYTLPKWGLDKIGGMLSKETQDWLEHKLGKGWGWGKEVQEEKLRFKRTLADYMVLVREQRIANRPETPGVMNVVEFKAESIQRQIDTLKYVPEDWKETMKVRVKTLLEQYQSDQKFETERYENEILQVADDYIGSTVSGQRVVRDAFNLATLMHNLKLVRGIGYGVLALAERSVKEYHQRQKLEDESAIPDSAFKKKMTQLVGDWQSGKDAVRKGSVELGRSVTFQGKMKERTGWKERTIDAVAGWAKVATFGWIGSEAWSGRWNPIKALSDFQQYSLAHGGWPNAVTDHLKMNYNDTFLTAPLRLATGELETTPDLNELHEIEKETPEYKQAAQRSAMEALVASTPDHDPQQVFNRVIEGAGFEVVQILDHKNHEVMIEDTANKIRFWLKMDNDPRPHGLPGMTVYRVGHQALFPTAEKPNLHPISLFGNNDASKPPEENIQHMITNLKHLKEQAWQQAGMEPPTPSTPSAPPAAPPTAPPPPAPEPTPATPSAPSVPSTHAESAPATPPESAPVAEPPAPPPPPEPTPTLPPTEAQPATPASTPPAVETPPTTDPSANDPNPDAPNRSPLPDEPPTPGQQEDPASGPRSSLILGPEVGSGAVAAGLVLGGGIVSKQTTGREESAPDNLPVALEESHIPFDERLSYGAPDRLRQYLTSTGIHQTMLEQYRRLTSYFSNEDNCGKKFELNLGNGKVVGILRETKGGPIYIKIPGDTIGVRVLHEPITELDRVPLKLLREVVGKKIE